MGFITNISYKNYTTERIKSMKKQITVGTVLRMKTTEELKTLNTILALEAASLKDHHHLEQFAKNVSFLEEGE